MTLFDAAFCGIRDAFINTLQLRGYNAGCIGDCDTAYNLSIMHSVECGCVVQLLRPTFDSSGGFLRADTVAELQFLPSIRQTIEELCEELLVAGGLSVRI